MNRKPFRIRLWLVLAAMTVGLGLVPAAFAADPSQLRDVSDPFGNTARSVAPTGITDPSQLRDVSDPFGGTARTAAPSYGQPDSWQLRPSDPYGLGSLSAPKTVGGGFEWGDASIGGAVGFGIALALLAMVSLTRRSHRGRVQTGRAALA